MLISSIVGFVYLVAVCGSVTADENSRILNGTTASNNKYAYQASLQDQTKAHFCGGSILNTNWVLTAAQCLDLVSSFTVVVGTHILTSGGTTYQVMSFEKHPLYDNVTMSYDVGVVKTTTPIIYSSTVQPVLLSLILPIQGTIGVVTGWGYTAYPGSAASNELKALNTTLLSTINCQKQLNSLNFTLQSTQFCTFATNAGACLGDEGSPITIGNMQFGIASVFACGLGYPDVYTGIPNVYSWIVTHV
ncbi:hypothetical protein RN001_010626 [Aquatica leii]|uniref:Peptidase S1 domain-containing protein n=1 Tax=Aquatica leii TaxID=1421715 RepID=A0AAN7Q3F2_9COLE|nr:hypothetical protein RN001_010626 [Aquatica leii]